MTSGEYEQITADIVASVFEHVEGIKAQHVQHGRRNRVQGKSGYRHQIDVSIRGAQDWLLVECKMWKDPVKVPAFLAFLARIIDIRPTQPDINIHASIVTTRGFQKGVPLLANYYNNQLPKVRIQLDKVSSPLEFVIKYKHLFSVGVQDDLNHWSDAVETRLDEG